MKKVLFLDLNGTLVDDWGQAYTGMKAIFDHYDRPAPSLKEFIKAVAFNGDYTSFYNKHEIGKDGMDLHDVYLPAYHRVINDVSVVPFLHEVLEELKKAGVEIHLLTAARRDFADRLVELSGVAKYCEAFHFHIHNKAAQVEAVISGMDVDQKNCFMVGDLPSDVLHSKKAGIKGIALLNSHVPRELFSEITEMDLAIFDLRGLLKFVL